ncbi:GDSL esterase/lipase 6-like [Bidens hawaiensis]|uniref:GDSL esterase/lipase 6-like n=1 Tax=Bidens hawaiensis TaxID=980011 RepID=UPI004049005F
MMERMPQLIIFLGVFLLALESVGADFKSVFVFGDSQFDAGNNRYLKKCLLQANFTPYGSSFFPRPTGRFTNGRTVADFIAQYLGIEFQKPYQEVYRELENDPQMSFPSNGVNFASAGSGLLPNTNQEAGVTSIQVQLQQFQSMVFNNLLNNHKRLHRTQIQNSLFFVVSGGNDIFSYFLPQLGIKPTTRRYVLSMLKQVVHFTTKIYLYGGRRIVLFSLGPISCIPGRVLIPFVSSSKCHVKMRNMADQYNAGLKRFVNIIPTLYPGAIGVYAAVYDTSKKFFEDPKLHGFSNTTHACCGNGPLNGMLQCGTKDYKLCKNPNEYIFWDFFHPSERTYELIAKAFWNGDEDEIWPMNLKTLAGHK